MEQKYLSAVHATVTSTSNGQYHEVFNMKTVLESLSGEGEEALIKKCRVTFHLYKKDNLADLRQFLAQPVVLIADAAIASAAAGAATNDVDEILDAATAGNLEFKLTGQPQYLRIRNTSEATFVILQVCDIVADFTQSINKASKRLIRSPMLATNPEISIGVVIVQEASSQMYCMGTLELDYIVRPRPARMI